MTILVQLLCILDLPVPTFFSQPRCKHTNRDSQQPHIVHKERGVTEFDHSQPTFRDGPVSPFSVYMTLSLCGEEPTPWSQTSEEMKPAKSVYRLGKPPFPRLLPQQIRPLWLPTNPRHLGYRTTGTCPCSRGWRRLLPCLSFLVAASPETASR